MHAKKKAIKIPKFAPENLSRSSLPKIFAEELRKNKGKTDRTSKKKFSGSETYGISHKKPGRIDAVNHPKAKKKFTRNYPDKTKAKKSRALKKKAKNDKRAKQKKRTAFCPLYQAKTGSIFPLEEENVPRARPP